MLSMVDKVVAKVSGVFAALGAALIGLLALTMVADVVGRQFGSPVTGIVELAAQTVVISAFLTIPYVMRKGGHIRATVLVNRTPPIVRKSLEVLAYLIGAIIFALLAFSAWDEFVEDFVKASFEGEGALRIPTWPARLTIFLASVLMIFESLLATAKTFVEVKK